MKFLVVGKEAMWCEGAFRLQEFEGHDVRMYNSKEGKRNLDGVIKKVQTLGEGLRWVGRDGYIISEDEADMTLLRRQGFKVYGGNQWTERIEKDRAYQLQLCRDAGIPVPDFHRVRSVDEGIQYIMDNPDQYVLKQEGNAPKWFSYVGREDDGSDVIDQLEWIGSRPEFKKAQKYGFILEEFVEGIEFATSAWWMYDDWKRDDDGKVIVEVNREHKKQENDDRGLTTGETGTVAMMSTKYTKLFGETLQKLTPLLKRFASDICINVDANCGIAEEEGGVKAYLFESTIREGYPFCALQQYLMSGHTEVGEFFADLIDGKQGNIGFKKDWGVVTVLGSGLYPDENKENQAGRFVDQPVIIPQWEQSWNEHIAPCSIRWDREKGYWRISDWFEYVLVAVHHDKDIEKANSRCVAEMRKIVTRAPHYRTDIGREFNRKELPKLIDYGYLGEELMPDVNTDLDESEEPDEEATGVESHEDEPVVDAEQKE
jgi:phosphoribosylamine-glycine ligase